MVSSIESQVYFLFHRGTYVLRAIAMCELCQKDIFLYHNLFANWVSEVPINLRSLILNTLSILFIFFPYFFFFYLM